MRPKKSVNPDFLEETTGPLGSETRRIQMWLGLAIAVFAFLLYARSISFQYTLDDGSVVKDNALTKLGIKGIPKLLASDYWYGFSEEMRVPEYRPASMVVFALEAQFFSSNKSVAHFVNVLFYTLTCWLLFQLLCKLFQNRTLLFPFVCALLYTAHPIHTEVVNSIKSLDEIFCFFFGLLSVYLSVTALERKSTPLLIGMGISYFVALCSKETAISYLVITPLTLFVFTKIETKKLMRIILIYIGVTIVFFAIWYKVVQTIPRTEKILHSTLNNTLFSAPDFISREATAFYILLKYALLLIFPFKLSYDYSFATFSIKQLSDPEALLGLALYLAIGVYAVLKIKDRNKKAFAILFYLLTLAPVSNVFLLIGATLGERFMYMPSVGFSMLIAFLLLKLEPKNSKKEVKNISTINGFLKSNSRVFVATAIIVFLYSAKTIARSEAWKNNIALFSTDVKTVPKSSRAHCNWGYSLVLDVYPNEKDPEKKMEILDQAIKELQTGLDIYSGQPDAYKTIARCYELKNDYKSQIKTLQIVVENSQVPDTSVYLDLAKAYSSINEFDMSLSMLDSAAKYHVSDVNLSDLRGYCYLKKKMPDQAIHEFKKYLKIDSTNVATYTNMGVAYLNLGERDEAVNFFEKAMKLDEKFAPAYCFMGRNFAEQKNYQEAIKYYNKSLALDSTNQECMALASRAYISIGDTAMAMSIFEKAQRMKSRN